MRTQLEGRCLDFGVGIIRLLKQEGDALTKRARDQLVASSTSVGANVAEARSAQSRADFINKMEIALKEARETDYWLNVLYRLADKATSAHSALLKECDEITAMIAASVKTAKRNGGIPLGERSGSLETRL